MLYFQHFCAIFTQEDFFDPMKNCYISHSPQETGEIAAEIRRELPDGGVIALYGDLGAGKTVFARGLAAALGITEPVSSPTYTILQEYPVPGGGMFYHLDLYRISDARAGLAFGVDEYLNEPGAWVLAEWPERIESLLPPGTIRLQIRHISETGREITLLP